MTTLFPVLLCGGSGTRLWPMSRDMYPKQFMKLGGHTLFGDTPTEAATNFGYIVHDNEKTGDVCFAVRCFHEKPNATIAENLIEEGNCYWNSGMFLFRADIDLEELQKYAPPIHTSVKAAWGKRQIGHDFLRPDNAFFKDCPSDSIDYAVMERTKKAYDRTRK